MSLSTHVLDLAAGVPATGMPVRLDRQSDADWAPVASGLTDADGRWRVDDAPPGVYRWVFEPGNHFFPEVPIVFRVTTEPHLHIPLLLSAFGYSTYKGS